MSDAVWVVEDDLALLDAMVALLREHGLSVRGFSDPRRALELAAADPPTVLVTDLAMPGLTGVELARALRSELASACPRIVLLAGSELRRVELTLFDHVVHRPFQFASVLQKVQSFVTPRSVRRTISHVRLRDVGGITRSGGGRE